MKQKNNFYVLTGGPGSGKTTLIDELKKHQYTCIDEVARKIIKNQIKTKGNALPWANTKEYSLLMMSESVKDFENLLGEKHICFFDRSIIDTLGYEKLLNFAENANLLQAIQKYRYNQKVFILPPWKEIYETDEQRKQSFEEALTTYEAIKEAYTESGYQLIIVPCMDVYKRAEFILSHIH